MYRVCFMLLILFFSVVNVVFAVGVEADANVVARVGGIPVTKFELQRQVDKVMPLRVNFHGGVSQERIAEIQAEAMDDLIERAYKIRYAINEEIAVPRKLVDEVIAKVREKFKGEDEFNKAVAAETLGGFRASLYRDFLAKKAEKMAVDAKIDVTEEQVRAYYDKLKHTFFMPKQFRASHILVKVDPASNQQEREELKAKAEDLLERAKAGEDFYDLAYYNSDDRTKYVGGDLGMFHEGQTVKPFEEALLKLKVGEISNLVKTRFGYHIIKLTQVNEARQLEYDEQKLQIRSKLESEQRDKIYQAWIDGLKATYPVERFDS